MIRIQEIPGNVILREDLSDLSSRRQISRAIKDLEESGQIAKIGYGIYAKTFRSRYDGTILLNGDFDSITREALNKLGVDWEPSQAEQDYNAARSITSSRTVYRQN